MSPQCQQVYINIWQKLSVGLLFLMKCVALQVQLLLVKLGNSHGHTCPPSWTAAGGPYSSWHSNSWTSSAASPATVEHGRESNWLDRTHKFAPYHRCMGYVHTYAGILLKFIFCVYTETMSKVCTFISFYFWFQTVCSIIICGLLIGQHFFTVMVKVYLWTYPQSLSDKYHIGVSLTVKL